MQSSLWMINGMGGSDCVKLCSVESGEMSQVGRVKDGFFFIQHRLRTLEWFDILQRVF